MRLLVKAATSLSAILLLANCAATGATQIAGNASAPAAIATASSKDVACLAEAVYFEAGGTGAKGEAAVAHVVVNRARSGKFPRSVCGVIADGCQFSYRCDGRSDALADPNVRNRAFRIAEAVLTGIPDITNGALFFHAASASPGWFNSRPRIGTFGGNIFYR